MTAAPRLTVRGLRFGLVGLSGVAVNQAVLWAAQNALHGVIGVEARRLDVALLLAIGLSTLNNFYWNQRWTWSDRVQARHGAALLRRLAGYFAACGVAIVLQFVLTHAFVRLGLHYLVANLLAIGLAAGVNFIINHTTTFARASAARDL
jgi:dolichol-phosphate mannosyltransferase